MTNTNSNSINIISLMLYTIHIAMNFMELSAVQYFYYFEVLFFFFIAFKYPWKDILFPTLIFITIEGQGRVLSNYNPIFVNIFDFYLIVIIIRSYIRDTKLIDFKIIPPFFYIMITMHFLWYIVQIFNYQNISPIAVLISAKIYIVPFFLFFLFVTQKINFKDYHNDRFLLYTIILMTLQSSLIYFQKAQGDTHMLKIHPYYSRIMGEAFIGHLFRPFGTSHLPGAAGVYSTYVVSVLFFFQARKKLIALLKATTHIMLIFACFMMQVRTILIQYILYMFMSLFMINIEGKRKYYFLPILFSSFILIPVAFQYSDQLDKVFPELNLGSSIARFKALENVNQAKSNRASFDDFFRHLSEKLEKTPFGLGPGRTGGASNMFINQIRNDLVYDLMYSWTLDNLFISLAIDFGWGMIFYSLIIIGFPLYLLSYFTIHYFKYNQVNRVIAVSAAASFVILLSNWGALAVPYNPVSFFFWFFVSSGLIEIRRDIKQLESNQEST